MAPWLPLNPALECAGQTDRQNCYINIARQHTDARYKTFEDIFSCYATYTNVTDRFTDGRTDGHRTTAQAALCVALCGNYRNLIICYITLMYRRSLNVSNYTQLHIIDNNDKCFDFAQWQRGQSWCVSETALLISVECAWRSNRLWKCGQFGRVIRPFSTCRRWDSWWWWRWWSCWWRHASVSCRRISLLVIRGRGTALRVDFVRPSLILVAARCCCLAISRSIIRWIGSSIRHRGWLLLLCRLRSGSVLCHMLWFSRTLFPRRYTRHLSHDWLLSRLYVHCRSEAGTRPHQHQQPYMSTTPALYYRKQLVESRQNKLISTAPGPFFVTYLAMLCVARIMPSQDVCPSIRPSHASILSKRLNISWNIFHRRVATPF